ncbi:MAG: hypothetical protein R2762_13285 [Bryobacteraceae bacterium]
MKKRRKEDRSMKNPNVIGLDVGTSRIVTARSAGGDKFEFAKQLNAFVSVPFSKMVERSLERDGVRYDVQGDHLIVVGDDSPRFADLLHVETRRPMTEGVLNPAEPESVPVIRKIIEGMVVDGDNRPTVWFSVPAAPLNAEEGLTYHEATLRQVFSDLGCEVQSINEGLAVVYSELEDTNYTGIGVSCGGGLCNVSLSFLSMPAMSFSIPKGGDFIDASAASVTGDLANRVRLTKEENFHFNGHFVDKLHQVLTVYYEDMMLSLINSMKEAFSDTRRMPKLNRPIPIVLAGGTSCPPGFRDRFERLLRATKFPVEISEVRMAQDAMTATARGALIAALTEAD